MIAAWDRFWHTPGPAHNLAAARVVLAVCAALALRQEHPAIPGHLLADVEALPIALWQPVGPLLLLPAPSQPLVDATGLLAVLATITTLVGAWTRLSTLALALSMTLLLGWTQSWGRIVHTWNLVVLLWWVLACAPAGAAFSWDARGRPSPPADGAFTWSVRALRMCVVMMWLLAGLNKVRFGGLAWLKARNLATILYSVNLTDPYRDPSQVALWIAGHPWLCSALALATVTLELGFVGVLFVRSNRARLPFLLSTGAFLIGAGWWLHLAQPLHLLALLLCVDWGALVGHPEPAPLSERSLTA